MGPLDVWPPKRRPRATARCCYRPRYEDEMTAVFRSVGAKASGSV